MKESYVVAIVQGRMNSSRLPGKILLDIAGKPMLAHVVERARLAKTVDQVLFATTTDPSDDPVAAFCEQRGYACYRGNLNDVLDRYYQALHWFSQDGNKQSFRLPIPDDALIIRLTADCPLIDPALIDLTVQAMVNQQTGRLDYDFACTRLPPPWQRTFPIGQDVEVCTVAALERAWKEADQPYQREHVMPYLYEECRSVHYSLTITGGQSVQAQGMILQQDMPRKIFTAPLTVDNPLNVVKVLVLDHFPDYGRARWTVDTPADLEFIRQIFDRLDDPAHYSWYDILAILQREPQLALINQETAHKDYREFDQRK
jgi:spore coat polysaccharide biosynthesis protein SpsF